MKRLIIGTSFVFVVTLLVTKFFEDQSWMQSLFAAVFQTVLFFVVLKYFIKWWTKKSEDKKSNNTN